MNIHPTAIVSQKAKIAEDADIGPYAVIEEDVQIGQGAKIYSHAHILNHTTIGDNCQIHMGAIIGHLPQMRKSVTTQGRLVIGNRNTFREYTTVHRSIEKEQPTMIGDDNYFMGFSHIAHDCQIANRVTVCNGTLVAGHVIIEDNAFISGNVTVHQFCRIGTFAMIGGLARVAKDVPPYMLLKGDSTIWAVNSVGLRRANFSIESRSQIKRAFKTIYKSDLNVKQAIERLKDQGSSPEINHLVEFISNSQRGICTHKKPSLWDRIFLSDPVANRTSISAYKLFRRPKAENK
ncbi:MAG: acyl-ACP--UDP-N-acetylglucosamine O-acyltransferase [Candidatus Omnitrophica bacterium]|nr:acyl-ACP--UDP-N-acetylglucosamine O-acyltransferase [Candidatus Omnitrophota bacterium]